MKVDPEQFNGATAMVPLTKRVLSRGSECALEVSFNFRKLQVVLDAARGCFVALPFLDHQPLRSYLAWPGWAAEEDVAAATAVWGPNEMNLPLPTFVALLQEQMLAPFFVFQARGGGGGGESLMYNAAAGLLAVVRMFRHVMVSCIDYPTHALILPHQTRRSSIVTARCSLPYISPDVLRPAVGVRFLLVLLPLHRVHARQLRVHGRLPEAQEPQGAQGAAAQDARRDGVPVRVVRVGGGGGENGRQWMMTGEGLVRM